MVSVTKIISMATQVKTNELRATIASFIMVFILMACYFILRPVRDAMASDWSDAEVSNLWNLQFFISIVIVSLYSSAISRVLFKFIAPLVYAFFAISFVIFYWLVPHVSDPSLAEKSFYVWVSTFSLFHLSVFWSLMSDTFSAEQSKRLFSVVSAGASAGAIIGPAIPTLLSDHLAQENLMLIAACGLICVIPIALYIYHLKHTELGSQNSPRNSSSGLMSGNWWGGFRDVLSNPLLIGISVFILLYVFVSSFIYFEQKNILADYSRADRTQILGGIDWIVNSLTFLMAFFITGRLSTRFGMPLTLALIPILLVIGMLILAIAPLIFVILSIQVARRAGNYSVTRPAREILFTQVTNNARYKAKPVIDVVVYRGGDAVSGTLFALLSEGIGIGLVGISLVGATIASFWAVVGIYLGKRFKHES